MRGAILYIPPVSPTCPPKTPRGAPIPPRPRQDRRDSGVSAAVWGWVVWCHLKTPTGRPYPSPAQAGPEGLGCLRRCVGVGGVVSPQNPHGASLSLPGPGRTGGTRVSPPLCGGGWCGVPPKPPRGVPIPPRPRQDRRDSGVSAAVWGWVVWCPLITPTGRPYPSPAQAGPEGLGCIRRCVGASLRGTGSRGPPTRSLHPACDRGASPYFKAIHGESDCRSCRQVPLPRRSEHRNGRRRPVPPPRRRLPFTPPSPSSRGPDRAPRRLR